MECLRSFNFAANGQANWTSPDVKTWFVGAQEFWAFTRGGSSIFNVQGFKNIDVYQIDVIGSIGPQVAIALGGGIPSDWFASLAINGQLPILGGTIPAPNDFNITTSSPTANSFLLGRFNNSVKFASPIKSVTSIDLNFISANGSGGQTTGNVNLQYAFNFVVYYKFEGE